MICLIIQFYQIIMRLRIFFFSLILLATIFTLTISESTFLTYYVQYEDEQQQDYIQITLKVEAQEQSLAKAISSAAETAQDIAALSLDYCKQNIKKGKGDCKKSSEIGKFQIEPRYQTIRKQNQFSAFIVRHEVIVRVFDDQKIGNFVDQFLQNADVTVEQFAWLPFQEKDPQESAIHAGVEEGENLCNQIGLRLGKIIDIEQIQQQQPKEENEEEDEEQQEQEQAEITIYKFEIECSKSLSKKKEK